MKRQPPATKNLREGQCVTGKLSGLPEGIAVDVLVFEFMGLAMIALCVVVVAVPSQRRPSRQFRDY